MVQQSLAADLLREHATRTLRQAAIARELSSSIGVRGARIGERLGPSRQQHTPDVWSSTAADQGRGELHSLEFDSLRHVVDDLALVRVALEQRSLELEAQARDERRRADAMEATEQAAATVDLGLGGFA